MIEVRKTAVGVPSLTLDEVKAFLRVDYDTDDVLIDSLILQSKDLIEEYLNVSLVQNMIIIVTAPVDKLALVYTPLGTIVEVKSVKNDEVLEYEYKGGYLEVKTNEDYYVEYATNPVTAPGLQLGWMEIIAWLYENRGDTSGLGLILYYNQNLMVYRRKVWI